MDKKICLLTVVETERDFENVQKALTTSFEFEFEFDSCALIVPYPLQIQPLPVFTRYHPDWESENVQNALPERTTHVLLVDLAVSSFSSSFSCSLPSSRGMVSKFKGLEKARLMDVRYFKAARPCLDCENNEERDEREEELDGFLTRSNGAPERLPLFQALDVVQGKSKALEIYVRAGDLDGAVQTVTEMWACRERERDQETQDALVSVTELAHQLGKWDIAWYLASMLKDDNPRVLFLKAVAALHVGEHKQSLEFSCRALQSSSSLNFKKKRAFKTDEEEINLKKTLGLIAPSLAMSIPGIKFLDLDLKIDAEGWSCLNPGIVLRSQDGVLEINLRAVNYLQDEMGNYSIPGAAAPFTLQDPMRTRNFRLEIDPETFKISSGAGSALEVGLRPSKANPEMAFALSRPHTILGLEDLRLFEYEQEVWFMATSQQVALEDNMNQIVLGKGDEVLFRLWRVPRAVEKNWLPFEKDGKMLAIYAWDPFFVVLEVDPETGMLRERLKKPFPAGKGFRGSAAPAKFLCEASGQEKWLAVVHEVLPAHNAARQYVHRFVILSDDLLDIIKISKPWRLKDQPRAPIEYVCGLAISSSSGQVFLGASQMDRRAFLIKMSLDSILAFCGI